MKQILFLGYFVLLTSTMYSQKTNNIIAFHSDEQEALFEKLTETHTSHLLEVCGDKMSDAYNTWSDMLLGFENFCRTKGLEINGVKVWINVFWDKNGKIEYIFYYPKPTSRNINYEQFGILLSDFAKQYQLDKTWKSSFSHYGTASFPAKHITANAN